MRSSADQWELGDKALAAEPVGRQGPRGGVGDRLDALAAELDVSPKSLRIMRGVAQAWPKKYRRKDLPWAVHSVLRGQEDRYDLIKQRAWTTREARELVASRRNN